MFGVTMAPGVEVEPGLPDRVHARRDLPVELAHHDRAAAAVVDDARLEVVGAEVDERADRALLAGDLGDGQLVQAVLRRDDAADLAARCGAGPASLPRCAAPSSPG